MKTKIFNEVPELTKVSSKGQLVIPSEIRRKMQIHEGNVFAVSSQDDLLVLKRIRNPMLKEDLRTLNEVKSAWMEIEKGESVKTSKDEFLKELDKW